MDAIVPGKYATRDGRTAYVFMTDAHGDYPVMGAIHAANGHFSQVRWTENGTMFNGMEHPFDLLEKCLDETD